MLRTLIGKAFLICFGFLILPLIIHSFLLYFHEIRLEQEEIRLFMQTIGTQIEKKISDQIQDDWKVLDSNSPPIFQFFSVQSSAKPLSPSKQFAIIQNKQLLIGKNIDNKGSIFITHPLEKFLYLNKPPFPIDIVIDTPFKDQWVERFPIPNTKMQLVLGTSPNRVYDLQWSHLLFRVGSFIALVLILGGVFVLLLLNKLSKPIQVLQYTLQRIGEGAIHQRYAKQSFGFEINKIGEQLNQAFDELLKVQKIAEKMKIEREKLAHELKIGLEIQKSLLPQTFENMDHLQIQSAFLPAREVGGDFYDVFTLSSGKILIVIGDVVDKGIGACLFSIAIRSTLRAYAEMEDDLSTLLSQANDLFLQDVKESGQFVTLWIGILDQNTLKFANLGHPPALLKREGSIRELTTDNCAMGLKKFSSVLCDSIQLRKNDHLLLYSDGVTETHNEKKQLFGKERLQDTLLLQGGAQPILEEIRRFRNEIPQFDDITILELKVIQPF